MFYLAYSGSGESGFSWVGDQLEQVPPVSLVGTVYDLALGDRFNNHIVTYPINHSSSQCVTDLCQTVNNVCEKWV